MERPEIVSLSRKFTLQGWGFRPSRRKFFIKDLPFQQSRLDEDFRIFLDGLE